jgi:hypothetical protein
MRRGGGATLELVEVNHLQAISRARVVGLTLRSPQGRTQCQPADTAHSIDSDFHSDSIDQVANMLNSRTVEYSHGTVTLL